MKNLIIKGRKLQLSDSISSDLLRNFLSYYSMVYSLPESVEKAEKEFAEWEINSDLQVSSAVLTYGVSELDKGEILWEKLQTSSYPHNQVFYRSLSASRDPDIISRLLQGSLKYDWVPLQNKYDILNAVSAHHPTAAFKFLKENYDTYFGLYGETQFNFGNILHTVVGNLKTRRDLEEAMSFFQSQNLGTGERAFKIAVEEVSSLLDWRDCCEEDLRVYLTEHPTS
ncbi:hypothetical protein ACHWQZ_G011839 [Mnemiopsis leidyi]